MNGIDFLRQFRIGNYAVFDFSIAFLGVYLLAPFLSKLFLKIRVNIPKKSWLLWTLPIALFIHLAIGNITPLTKNFIDPKGHYFLKAVILVLFIFGLRGVKLNRKQGRKIRRK